MDTLYKLRMFAESARLVVDVIQVRFVVLLSINLNWTKNIKIGLELQNRKQGFGESSFDQKRLVSCNLLFAQVLQQCDQIGRNFGLHYTL